MDRIPLPDLDRIPGVDQNKVFTYIHQLGLIETIIQYAISWIQRTDFHKIVNVKNWYNENKELPDEAKKFCDEVKKKNLDERDIILEGLGFTIKNFKYAGDTSTWKMEEKWNTPMESWMRWYATVNGKLTFVGESSSKPSLYPNAVRCIDCEDGTIFLNAMLDYLGIPDNRRYITTGDVLGGGHCYLIFVDDDTIEYPIDWCYWPDISAMMKIPYHQRSEYMYGDKEWFRFNSSGMYKLR